MDNSPVIYSTYGIFQMSLSSVSSKISVGANALIRGTLWCSDHYLNFLLVRGQNERLRPPSQRISFPQSVREEIWAKQRGLCMYCGTYLARGWHLDHIYPREHGGSNNLLNLQALCPPCNLRKGVQTDEEYRHRFRKLLKKIDTEIGPVPPEERIPKWEFDKITKQSGVSQTARSRRRSKYTSPRQKIVSGSFVTGLFLGVLWAMSASLIFRLGSIGTLLFILAVGFIIWISVSSFLIGRARHTGKLVSQESEMADNPQA